ncbi:MAG TPA: helix-hairpin-helix domain-containing protein [Kofleriaceae bacterium]|nr:helix-hairpin-helix domain-containing protein [Kofleriaceae bacterium]
MNALPLVDLLGYWVGIFLTFCILSFLYKDNPFYKIAEHLFIGVSIGYVIIQQYYNTLRPKLIESIADADRWYWNLALIPLLLVAMMFIKVASQKLSWMGRYPLAFVVALYAGLQINGVAQADLGQQIKRGMAPFAQEKVDINAADQGALISLGLPPTVADEIIERRATTPFTSLDEIVALPGLTAEARADIEAARGSIVGLDARASTRPDEIDAFGTFGQILLFLGLIASLIYFYFSIEQKGAIGAVSRFGVWVLMIGFGASFGFTVMGRLALAIGRVQNIRGDVLPTEVAAQVHGPVVAFASIAIIVVGLIIWELRNKKRVTPTSGSDSGAGSSTLASTTGQ